MNPELQDGGLGLVILLVGFLLLLIYARIKDELSRDRAIELRIRKATHPMDKRWRNL